MKIAFFILTFFHGLIHLAGFAKAYNYGNITQLSQAISKPLGIAWLIAALLFILTALLFIFKYDMWWSCAAAAVLLSQFLIFTNWHDAKFGTIANIIILLAGIIGYGNYSFYKKYASAVNTGLQKTNSLSQSILSETDMQYLPEAVKKYIRHSGAVGKPKVKNFKIEFTGQIRKDETSAWMPFTSEQYNFTDAATRLFFMKASMKHLPVAGFHSFNNGQAFMDIRLLSLFKVQYQSGKEMGIAETVTFFNDMCCMAPATLIDKRIQWQTLQDNVVQAIFTNNDISISAALYFNDHGELINFVSKDRYVLTDNSMKQIPWSSPLQNYKIINGYKLAGTAKTIYYYPKADLCYGNFSLVNIVYNCKTIQ